VEVVRVRPFFAAMRAAAASSSAIHRETIEHNIQETKVLDIPDLLFRETALVFGDGDAVRVPSGLGSLFPLIVCCIKIVGNFQKTS
jgi:hypothetical protein